MLKKEPVQMYHSQKHKKGINNSLHWTNGFGYRTGYFLGERTLFLGGGVIPAGIQVFLWNLCLLTPGHSYCQESAQPLTVARSHLPANICPFASICYRGGGLGRRGPAPSKYSTA